MALEAVYPFPASREIDDRYLEKTLPVIHEQLAKVAVWLARVLNTNTSIRFPPAFTCLEMSTRHGGATRMPATRPFTRTSAVATTFPRSSAISPRACSGVSVTVLRYHAPPE